MTEMGPLENVSRETEGRLDIFCQMVTQWNRTINLVAASSIPHLRQRHIADSLQVMQFSPAMPQHWVDMGSGGGFPGLVVAACLAEQAPNCRVTLIESDQRKMVFLKEAARAMGLSVAGIVSRIESAPPQNADVVSARALAPLDKLLHYAMVHLSPGGRAIFPKGQGLQDEIAEAEKAGWSFDATQHKSLTDPTGNILVLQKISRDSAI